MDVKKIVLVIAAVSLLFISFYPVPAKASGPRLPKLLIKYYDGVDAVWEALKAGEIDVMNWPITYTQYQELISDPDLNQEILVDEYYEFGMFEIDLNSNYTSLVDPTIRNPLNYTEFRQALAFCVDKEWLLTDVVKGFGTRIDTPVSRPLHNNPWVNFDYSMWGPNGEALYNYPYEYNTTAALELLYNNGWYDTSIYPTFDDLYNAYINGDLEAAKGTQAGVIYPPGHEKAGQPLDPIKMYIRSDHEPRHQAGLALKAEMEKLGIPTDATEGPSSVCAPPVMRDRTYHIYTGGWGLGRFPLHFYALYTPIGIFEWGPNYPLIQDHELTYWAELEYPNCPDYDTAVQAAKECQRILIERCYGIWLYTSGGYVAYRKGWLGIVNEAGNGFMGPIEHLGLNAYHEDPSVDTIRWGLNQPPPTMLNPLFSQWVYEYEVIDRIFGGYGMMSWKPYDPSDPGHSPVHSDMPWYAVDWDRTTDDNGNDHIHIWIRDDITFHDGTPFTVHDINYTIYLILAYPDSWGYPDLAGVINSTIIHNDYYIEIIMNGASYWNVYVPGVMPLPKHIYEQISDHHGTWPGEAEGWTPEQVYIGIGAWKFVEMSDLEPGGYCLLEANPDFWLSVTLGEVDFVYSFDSGTPPQGGRYQIGLPDLVAVALAYGSSGYAPPDPNWNPGCDLAQPSGTIGLPDLVTVALHYGETWGEYTPPP